MNESFQEHPRLEEAGKKLVDHLGAIPYVMLVDQIRREFCTPEARTKALLDAAADTDFKPRTYTDAEKCEVFDKLYEMAHDEFKVQLKEGESSKDIDHWCYEAVMNLLGPGVWEAMR